MVALDLFHITLTLRDAIVSVVVGGLLCHLIFNRLEPRSLSLIGVLIFIAPLSLVPLLVPHCSNVAWAVISSFAIYLFTLTLSVIVYRLSPFHPLAKYPGPILNKVSKLLFTAIAVRGKQHVYYQELHRKYGDIVRVGPNELSFCNSASIAPIMGPNGMPKGPYWDGRIGRNGWQSIVGLRDPDAHSKRRRLWSRGFTSTALKYYLTLIDRRVDQLLETLKERSGSSGVDIAEMITWFAFDFINDITFGTGHELMREGDKVGLWDLMKKAHPVALGVAHIPWIRPLLTLMPMNPKFLHFRKFNMDRSSKLYHEGSLNKNLFYHLSDEAGLEPERPAYGQVSIDSGIAEVAGSDTISTALPSTIWFLLRHPQAYHKLLKELGTLNDNNSSHDDLARLPYLNAVINETLRLLPPVLSGSQRAPRIGSGGQMVGSHFVPEGTSACVPTYALQRDERYFSLAEQFIPERWLPAEERTEVFGKQGVFVHDTTAYIPFSAGPGDCIGKRLALQEMRLVLCALLRRFDMKFADGYDPTSWDRDLLDFYVTTKGKLPVVLTVRS